MMKVRTKGPDETRALGSKIGKLLKAGDTVALYGELGAGKTTIAKGIAHSIGIEERDIVSASFTIIAEYRSDPPFVHIDLYRINTDAELEDIGLGEVIGGRNIAVMEWAEKAAQWLPDDVIQITLKPLNEDEREITVEGLHEKDRNCR
jgi:tRNA threonylcarbamoyladenosine biosynthesis protein TsaE